MMNEQHDLVPNLTSDEIQFLIGTLDTHVRQHGLQVATNSVVVLQKLQAVLKARQAKPEPDEKEAPEEKD